jgi:hypothetical protein
MMHIPAELDRDGIEHYRLEVERMLNRLTLEAEAWAEAGTRKANEFVARRERAGTGRDTALGWPLSSPRLTHSVNDLPRRHGGTELAA